MILGFVDTIFAVLGILIKEILIVLVLLLTRLIIKANILVTHWTTPADVILEHVDVLVQFLKDDCVNLLHQVNANSLHILIREELFIGLVNNWENLLGKEVKALAQTGTQTVLLDPLIFVVVYVFDGVKLLLFSPSFIDCVVGFSHATSECCKNVCRRKYL